MSKVASDLLRVIDNLRTGVKYQITSKGDVSAVDVPLNELLSIIRDGSEVWSLIVYEGFKPTYNANAVTFVSTSGRLLCNDGTIRDHQKTNKDGYACTTINLPHRSHTVGVHCLVCRTFRGRKPTPFHTVDHVDRCRTNNNLSNLVWADRDQQMVNRKRFKNGSLVDFQPPKTKVKTEKLNGRPRGNKPHQVLKHFLHTDADCSATAVEFGIHPSTVANYIYKEFISIGDTTQQQGIARKLASKLGLDVHALTSLKECIEQKEMMKRDESLTTEQLDSRVCDTEIYNVLEQVALNYKASNRTLSIRLVNTLFRVLALGYTGAKTL